MKILKILKSKRFIICAACVLAAAAAITAACIIMHDLNKTPAPVEKPAAAKEQVTEAPSAVKGGRLTVGVDFDPDGDYKTQIDDMLTLVYSCGGNCVTVPVMGEKGVIYDSSRFKNGYGNDILEYIVSSAHGKALVVYAIVDPVISPKGEYDVAADKSIDEVSSEISKLSSAYKIDGVVFRGMKPQKSDNPSYSQYALSGGSMGYDAFREQSVFTYIRKLCRAVLKGENGICVGVDVPCSEVKLAEDLIDCDAVNFAFISDLPDNADGENGYIPTLDSVIGTVKGKKPVYVNIAASGAAAGKVGENVLTAQVEYLTSKGNNGIMADSLSALNKLEKLANAFSSVNDVSFGVHGLTVSSPSSHKFTSYTGIVSFIGSSDPSEPLLINGKDVKRTAEGYFSFDVHLREGINTFRLVNKGTAQTYRIEYKKIIIRSVFPEKEQTVDGNTEITVSAVAKGGATLWARIGSETKKMTATGGASNDSADTFYTYTASFTTPAARDVPVNMGEYIVTASLNGKDETKSGGSIVVRAKRADTQSITSTPAESLYESGYGIQTGQGDRYVAEVTVMQTETLDIISPIDERSRPVNAYLPRGTVDYCSDKDTVFFNPESGDTVKFRSLDYGKRVYSDKNIKIFKATLPEHNTITAVDCTDNGRHTVITFDTAWKAPFNVTLSPQNYADPYKKNARPDYTVSSLTYEYIDIEFCYTQSGQGTVDLEGNPIFSRAEWIKGSRGYYVLRLYLRQKGRFYGWTAEYNEDNQLQFYFLDPAQITPSDNSYGYTLEGVKIVVDAGHGGPSSPGAMGSSKTLSEAALNLILAKKVQRELENLGATVIMTRTADTTLDLEPRNVITQTEKPDLFISIHRNASDSTKARGYDDFYFYPFSKPLADAVYGESVKNFTVGRSVQYYPFYVTRVSCCPAILTENGFMTNSEDFELIKTDAHNEKQATLITQGIVNYLASLKIEE